MPSPLTIVIPTYNQPLMLARQMEEAQKYPPEVRVLVIDDGGKTHPAEVVPGVELYRIEDDIPWNIGGARNLAARVAPHDWMVGLGVDHVLPAECVGALLDFDADSSRWYRMGRYRVGRADEFRRKDKIADDVEFGPVHPGMDIWLMHRDKFFAAGGYNEEYSGSLGTGGEFLKRCGDPLMLPDPICTHVYTTHAIADASVRGLSRDTSEYRRKMARLRGRPVGQVLRFRWRRVQ